MIQSFTMMVVISIKFHIVDTLEGGRSRNHKILKKLWKTWNIYEIPFIFKKIVFKLFCCLITYNI